METVSLWRFTPSQALSLADTNSGDESGDLGFFLDRRALTARCRIDPTNLRCFLAPFSQVLYGVWRVEVDLRFGPYLSCVPVYTTPNLTRWNVSDYACHQDCDTPTAAGVPSQCPTAEANGTTGPDGQITCFCPAARRAVGRFGPAPDPPPPPPPSSPRSCAYASMVPKLGRRCGALRIGGRVISAPVESPDLDAALSGCCDACALEPRCTGYRVLDTGLGAATDRNFSCQLIDGGDSPDRTSLRRRGSGGGGGDDHLGLDDRRVVYCGTRDPLPGGGWNWEVWDRSGGYWFSTPRAGECSGAAHPGDGSGCSWRVVGLPRFVQSECVLKHLDYVVAPARDACARRLGCDGTVPESECFFRCYWEVVGGGGYSPSVAFATLERGLAAAFESCPPHPGV